MANVIKTVITYPLNGTTKDFNIPFEYLARKFVRVTLIGVDRKVLTLNTDYRFATKTAISTTQAWGPAQGYHQIEIRRYTSATERLVDFTDGSILRAYDLNIAQIQTMHVAEEARDLTADTIGVNNDGHLDARGRRIVNVANAVEDGDAVSFGQLKSMNQNAWDSQNLAAQYRNEAQVFRNEAETFKNLAEGFKNQTAADRSAAATSANDADASATDAINSKNAAAASQIAAKTSETNAANSANTAKVEADRSTREADRAKSEADKLGNWNQLAGAVDRVDGTKVFWKGEQHSNGRLYLSSDGFNIGQYQQFFGNSPDRYSVMEWGDKDGWHLYSQRQTEGGTPTLHLSGNMLAARDVRAMERVYANGGFQMDREDYWPGKGTFGTQYTDRSAPFLKVGRFNAPNGRSEYYPIIKAFVATQDHGYGTAASFGMLTSGDGNFARGCIHVIGDNGTHGLWEFNPNDGGFTTRGDVHVGAGGIVYQNGDIYGTVWGNRPLTQWLYNETINRIEMSEVNIAGLWRAGGIRDGGGKVITGIVNVNNNDYVDECHWRVMQYVRNNGQRFNIY